MKFFMVLVYWHPAFQGGCSCMLHLTVNEYTSFTMILAAWTLELYILCCFNKYATISFKIARYLKYHSA